MRVGGSRCSQCGAEAGTPECGRAMTSALLQVPDSVAPEEGGKAI